VQRADRAAAAGDLSFRHSHPTAELVRLAHLRWQIELDYRELKDELGLDHYEGRSYTGWHHHTPRNRAAPTAAPQVLDRPLPNLPTADRDPKHHPPQTPTRVTKQ
jgi:SRSO17 transposase